MPGRDLFRARPPGGGRPSYHRTRDDAEAWLQRRLGRAEADFDPDRSLAEYVNHWFAIRAPPWSPDTAETYRYQLAHLTSIGTVPLRAVRADHLERVKADLLTGGLSRRRTADVVTLARRALRDAVTWEILERSRWESVVCPIGPRPEPEGYDVREARALLDACARHRFGHAFALALDAGLRWGELVIVQWADVDLEAGILRVRLARKRCNRIDEPKWGKQRTVDLALSLPLLRAARKRMPAARYILDHAGRPYHPHTVRLAWRPLLASTTLVDPDGSSVALRYLSPHRALRATSATLRLAAGEPLPDVAADLGHASTATTARYLAPAARRRREGAVALAGMLGGTFAATDVATDSDALSGSG